MTIQDVVKNIDELNEDMTVFAKRINGKFENISEVFLLPLPDDDQVMTSNQMSERFCPGFDYFLEIFLIKEFLEGAKGLAEYQVLDNQIKGLIYFVEFDAYLYDFPESSN